MIRLTAVIELEGHGPRALTHESAARTVIVGRDPTADFQIPLNTISRQHIRISESDNVYIIEDLGSTHGSLLNGKKLTKGDKKVLRDGDVVELTKAKITCNIEQNNLVESDPAEGTQAIAAKAVQGILGRLGGGEGEGPYLRVLSGPEEGKRFPFTGTQSEWALGRSKDCEFLLNDPNVSRRHAIVKKDWNGFTVQDLGSKNGVIVNERKIGKPRRLKDRDEIIIGPVKLVYVDPDAELMAALADVPGFESEESEEMDLLEADPSQLGAPANDGQGDGDGTEDSDGFEGDFGAPLGNDELDEAPDDVDEPEQADDYANIDPDLLAGSSSRFPVEWAIVGVVVLILVGAAVLLMLVL